jgi:hypothetical protein
MDEPPQLPRDPGEPLDVGVTIAIVLDDSTPTTSFRNHVVYRTYTLSSRRTSHAHRMNVVLEDDKCPEWTESRRARS